MRNITAQICGNFWVTQYQKTISQLPVRPQNIECTLGRGEHEGRMDDGPTAHVLPLGQETHVPRLNPGLVRLGQGWYWVPQKLPQIYTVLSYIGIGKVA